jgi:predicted O-methyltransferase YrrM
MEALERLLLDYALLHSTPEDEVLTALHRETYLKTIYPRMVSGPMQGKFLEMISRMIRPSMVLEIGTFTGYSAICLARGLEQGGMLHTIEKNDELFSLAGKYFIIAGLNDRIIQHSGDARDIIPNLKESFDLVFIDGDKQQYLQYYQLAMEKLVPEGFILADNVLWNGKVIADESEDDKETRGIREFNKFVACDTRVEKIILPIRDGISIIRKMKH